MINCNEPLINYTRNDASASVKFK